MIKCSQITTLLEENPQYIFTFNPEDENVHEHPIAVANQSKYSISNQKFLQELCQTNSIEKISVFDRYGRILATNNSDWYYVISDDPNSQAYPFWEILAERKDEIAQDLILNDEGDYAQYIGRAFYYYTITNEDGSIRYVTQKDYDSQLAGTWTGGLIQKNRGLVQINIAPERLKTVAGTATLEYVVSHMNVYGSGKVIIFDTSENHQCIYSNNDLDLNLSASALGFSSDAFDETGATYSGTTTLNGNEYFQILKYSGGRYTGVLVPTDDVYAKRTYVSLTIFISSLIGIMVLMIVNCLFGAKEEALYLEGKQNAEKRSRNEKETITVTLPSGKTKKTRSAAARWDAPAVAWRDKSPDQKLATITTLLVYVFITITVLGILFARIGLFDIKLVNYTYSVVAKRGLNIFTLTQGIIILLIVFYIAKIVQLLIQVTAENVGSRAETLGHLLASVIRYGVVIWAIFYILYLCGLDTGSLLASAGILSLVIGLGAQSMIQDILAGLFIVF